MSNDSVPTEPSHKFREKGRLRTKTENTTPVPPPCAKARTHARTPRDGRFILEHLNDPNRDITQYEKRPELEFQFVASSTDPPSDSSVPLDFDDESPYPEVRAAVSNTDDPTMPVNTFRVWFLGIFWAFVIPGTNAIFARRYPSTSISALVAQLLTLPLGHSLAWVLPRTRFKTFGYIWSLNPGPFNIKEHGCIAAMVNIAQYGALFSSEVIITQRLLYNVPVPLGYQLLLAIGSQIPGFCFAGFLRKLVVWPASMLWPITLANVTLLSTLHRVYKEREPGRTSKTKFLYVVVGITFLWQWIPGFFIQALSLFNWVCWIKPDDVVVNTLFGAISGLGMGALTFDWAMISYIGSPLITPWWSQANTGASFVVIFWVLAPILYCTNVWNSAYFPISSYVSWDNTGLPYNVTAVLDNGKFDPVKYKEYSPLFMSLTLALGYGCAFATLPGLFVHTFLWFRKDILRRLRHSIRDERDIHCRLMVKYPEVPAWWYIALGAVTFPMFLVASHIGKTALPAWASFVAVLVSACASIPAAMIEAVTNQVVPFNIIQEMIAGYILPGRPIANANFKNIGTAVIIQAILFTTGLKLGHYIKIPPRVMFLAQVTAATIAAVWEIVIQAWMFDNIEGICTPSQKQGFVCPASMMYGTASIIWGGIGPQRIFNPGAPYSGLLWFFLIGAIAPIPFYFLARRYPLSFFRYINIPVFFSGVGAIPPATGLNYSSWILVGFIFNWFVRRRYLDWWIQHNYLLSVGLDVGTIISMLVMFFGVQMAKTGGVHLDWKGNNVMFETADSRGTPFKTIPEGGFIGPSLWE